MAGRPLTAVLLPRPDAARAVADRWDRDEAVAVLDPDLPAAALERLLGALAPSHVGPTAVEAVLARAPGVLDVCVAGASDPEWGERVVHVDAIPRTSGGKLLRRELRAPR